MNNLSIVQPKPSFVPISIMDVLKLIKERFVALWLSGDICNTNELRTFLKIFSRKKYAHNEETTMTLYGSKRNKNATICKIPIIRNK